MTSARGTSTTRTWRRWLPWALLVVLLAAVACGDDDAGPGATATGIETATATAASSESPAASESPGATEAETATPAQVNNPWPVLGTRTNTEHPARDPAFEALPGAEAHFGQLGDAVYRIEIPAEWNGELVLWAHGFRGFGGEIFVDEPPEALRQALIERGYAWAASSYSENGYTPGIGADDTVALREYFASEFGDPGRVYLVGASMGGNVVTLSLEHYEGAYDGALSICGAVAGQEQVDFLISWGMVAEFTAGTTIPIGSGTTAVGSVLLGEISPALGTPASPTERGEQFLSIIRELTGGARPFYIEGLADQYIDNFGLLLLDPDRESLAGRAATNADHVYAIDEGLGLTAAEINDGIRRLEADPEARDSEAHPDAVPTSGQLTAPLLTLHGTGDLFVPISMEQSYRAKVEAAGVGDLLVQRAIRAAGHCNFSDAELMRAWEDLVGWVEDGTVPAGDDLTGDLADIGLQFTNPLRPGDPGTVAANVGAYAPLVAKTISSDGAIQAGVATAGGEAAQRRAGEPARAGP